MTARPQYIWTHKFNSCSHCVLLFWNWCGTETQFWMKMLCKRFLASYPIGSTSLPLLSTLNRSSEQRNWYHIGRCRRLDTNVPKFLSTTELDKQTKLSYCTGLVNGTAKREPDSETGLIKRVLNKVGFSPNTKTRLRVASHMLYETVADKINYLTFFNDFQMPNTFNSWFLVTELHVWMLLVRSMAEGAESGQDGRFLRNSIVEAMWGDVNTRAKKLGANNASRTRKQIEILSEQFQAALIAYDEGVMSDDRVLAASLWRRFFEMDCDDYEQIERLVKYVRKNIIMLDGLSREEFLNKPKIPWIDLQTIII